MYFGDEIGPRPLRFAATPATADRVAFVIHLGLEARTHGD